MAAGACSAGDLLGAYCLSEAHAGSDPAAMRTRAVRDGDDYVIRGAEGLDHPRRRGRLLQGDGPDVRRRGAGISCFLVPGGHTRPQRRHTRAEDGPDGLDHGDDACSTTCACRPSGGSARRGKGSGSRWPASMPADSASPRWPRAGPERSRRLGRLRQGARDVRQADHRAPGTGVHPRRHGRGRGVVAGHLPGRRPHEGRRPPVRPPGGDRQARLHRQRDEGRHRRRPGARRRRLHPRLPGRALHARGQGHADLRGHQPDPAAGDQPLRCHARRGAGRTTTRPSRTPSRPGPCCSCRRSR